MTIPLRRIMCCCKFSGTDEQQAQSEHKYCGCKDVSSGQPQHKAGLTKTSLIKSCDDRSSVMVDEVCEALEYDFGNQKEEEICILKPVIPFSHDLKYALHPQSDIVIQGVIRKNTIRFTINFLIGHNENPDVAFHFNPRMVQRYVACNTFLDGRWGKEEGLGQHKFPFVIGEPFLIEFFLSHSEFMVAIDGLHYCSYTYRTSLLDITGIEVIGSVVLSRVHLRTSSIYPSPLPPDFPPSPYVLPLNSHGTTPNENQITPVYGILQGKLVRNSEIKISGQVKLLPFSFFVNLQEGVNIWPHPEIPLHFTMRLNRNGKFIVLANAWINDGWGREELAKDQPFFPGSDFTLRILCLDNEYIVQVDGQCLLSFKHRKPYTKIDTILIRGDIFVYNIKVNL